MTSPLLRYRPCVGICLFNRDGLVFVGERIDSPGGWQMPQGGIDPGEDVEIAAFRELYEEVGIKNAEIIQIFDTPIRYDVPQEILDRLPWGREYGGQEQTWVAMLYKGDDTGLNLETHTHPEFARYQWVPLSEVPKLIVPFKVATYTKIAEAFAGIPTQIKA